VTGPYASALMVASLLLFVWALVLVLVDRPPGRALLVGAAVFELALVVFAIGGVVQMAGTDRDLARLEFVGYLLGTIVVVPAAVWWVRDERSRAAAGVLAVVFLLMPVLIVRVQQVWAGTGG
jgi:hypothetical protein